MNRYLLDARPLQHVSSVRGIGTYVRGLLGGFRDVGVADDVELLISRGESVPDAQSRAGIRIAPAAVPSVKRRLQPLVDPLFMSYLVRHLRPGLFHGVEWAQPLASAVPVVMTVHDLIPFVMPESYPWMRRERMLGLHQLRRASAVIADSSATAADVERLAHVDPGRIHVVHLAAAGYAPASAEAMEVARTRYDLPGPFLLATGTFDPRKRIGALVDAARRVRAHHDITLVIAGSQGNFAGPVARTIENAGMSSFTRVLGFIPRDDLTALYGACECFIFTSAYEGFGLPLLEAMACGAPVVAFRNSSIPEVVGGAAVLVEDGDVGGMTSAISTILADGGARERLGRAGRSRASDFSWQATAAATLEVYRQVLGA